MSTTRRLLTAATIAAVVLAGCGGSDGDDTVAPLAGGATTTTTAAVAPTTAPSDVTTAAAEAPATTTTAATGDRTGTPVAAVSPRTIDYRHFTVAVDGAVTSKEEPDTFDQPAATPQFGDATYLYVQVAVKNVVSFASGFIAYDEVRLVPAKGDPITMDQGVGKATDVLDGGATGRGWFAYEVPAGFDVNGATLVFGSAGEEPTTLPLTGTPPAPVWPKTVTVPSPGEVRFLNGAEAFAVKVTVDEAKLATAFAFDRSNRTSVTTKQALSGRRWLYVAFTAELVAPAADNHTSEVLGYDAAVLVVNGERQSGAPEEGDSEVIEVGAPYHGVYVFDVPATGKVQLAWGDKGGAVLVDVPVS